MINKLNRLNDGERCNERKVMYYYRDGILNGSLVTVKFVIVEDQYDFVECMHYVRMLLNDIDKYHVDRMCYEAKGDFQKIYDRLISHLKPIIDFIMVDNFVVDDFYALASDVNMPSNPVYSGILLFCEENWVFHKVEDFASEL